MVAAGQTGLEIAKHGVDPLEFGHILRLASGDNRGLMRTIRCDYSTEAIGKPHKVVLRSELGDMKIEIVDVLNSFVSSLVCPYDTVPGATWHRKAAQVIDESVRLTWNGKQACGWCERGYAEGLLA